MMDFDTIVRKMKDGFLFDPEKLGFTWIGSGCSAEVYAKDDVVLKVFESDGGYMRWLDFCYENQDNPYVPKLFSKIYRAAGSDHFAVFMEMLDLDMLRASDCDVYIQCSENHDVYPEGKEPEGFVSVASELSANTFMDDLHDENIMFRGDQPVVTDPWSAEFYEWDVNEKLIIEV